MSTNFADKFDRHYQQHFVNFLLRDSGFVERVHPDIKPEMFADEMLQIIVRLILQHYDAEKAAPGTLIFRRLSQLRDGNIVSAGAADAISKVLDELFELPLRNRTYLLSEFADFVVFQTFSTNIIPAAQYMERGDYPKAKQLVLEVFEREVATEVDIGGFYTADPSTRIARRLEQDQQRFWTLIAPLDAAVQGIARGELAVWQSQRSSGGKSAAMVLTARNLAFLGFNVWIVSLEMSKEQYEDRLDMCAAGLLREQLTDREKISLALCRILRGQIFISQFPGKLTKTSDLMRYKKIIENVHGFHPDVVLLDYADELASESGETGFEGGKEVYSMVRGWAVKDQIAIWTGMQSNRPGMEAEYADMEHSGESIAKAWIADLIVSINRSPDDLAAGRTTLYVVKNRNNSARFPIVINTDFSRMAFYTLAER